MSTPKLSTAIRSRIERRDRQAQTAFPAKVTAWKSSDNTVELEPQFIETWVNRDGTRQSEEQDIIIKSVPVCYPRSGRGAAWTLAICDGSRCQAPRSIRSTCTPMAQRCQA
jgi:hypothetical protein